MLDDCGGDQAVNGIADGHALASEFAVNRRAQFKGGTVGFKVNEVFKVPLGGDELLFLADALQDFGENEAATTKVVAVLDALFQFLRLFGVAPVEEINPDGCVHQDFHAVRVRRMAARFPVQLILPLRASKPFCFSRRTSSDKA